VSELRIRVPASSANLGPGFDSFALALPLLAEFELRPAKAWSVTVEGDGHGIAVDDDNLFVVAARATAQAAGRELVAQHVTQRSAIPVARGLGSSAAAIVGGAVAANALLGEPFDRRTLLRIASGRCIGRRPARVSCHGGNHGHTVLEQDDEPRSRAHHGRDRQDRQPEGSRAGAAAQVPERAHRCRDLWLARHRRPAGEHAQEAAREARTTAQVEEAQTQARVQVAQDRERRLAEEHQTASARLDTLRTELSDLSQADSVLAEQMAEWQLDLETREATLAEGEGRLAQAEGAVHAADTALSDADHALDHARRESQSHNDELHHAELRHTDIDPTHENFFVGKAGFLVYDYSLVRPAIAPFDAAPSPGG